MIDSYACVQVTVQLVPFNPEEEDASVLWTESKDVGKGFRCIRMVNNTRLGFDAFHGDKDHGGVHDSTTVHSSWGPEAHSVGPKVRRSPEVNKLARKWTLSRCDS